MNYILSWASFVKNKITIIFRRVIQQLWNISIRYQVQIQDWFLFAESCYWCHYVCHCLCLCHCHWWCRLCWCSQYCSLRCQRPAEFERHECPSHALKEPTFGQPNDYSMTFTGKFHISNNQKTVLQTEFKNSSICEPVVFF